MADEDKAKAFIIDNWASLGVEEFSGILHMPASIKRRTKEGGVDEVPVMLRNVTNAYKFRARVIAREQAARFKLDLDRDTELVEMLENYAILTFAIRDPKTFDQHVPNVETLIDLYDTQSLAEIWGRYDVWVEMLDPRFGEMDADQLWRVIVRIAKEKNPAPLVSMPGLVQFTCITLMAKEACHSPNRPSWLQPSEIYTPGS